jgi:hypothetical protein
VNRHAPAGLSRLDPERAAQADVQAARPDEARRIESGSYFQCLLRWCRAVHRTGELYGAPVERRRIDAAPATTTRSARKFRLRYVSKSRAPSSAKRASPATSNATATDSDTENSASRRPMVFIITANVEMQGT